MTSLLRRRGRPETDTTAPVISMVDVGVTYPNGKVALADVNVAIASGDFAFLVGPSGAGKSTFIRLLIREQLPTTGSVTVAGHDLHRMRRGQVPALRRRIGTVFQDFRLLPSKTVAENVAFALEVTGASRARTRERVGQLLSLVGLHEHAHHLPTQLSGGEQQRTAIARALANAPKIVLADEPTGNLDPGTAALVFRELIALIEHTGVAALIATHNMDLARGMHRVLRLEDGLLHEARPADVV
jgi:cell division transport system ATP-binding protein